MSILLLPVVLALAVGVSEAATNCYAGLQLNSFTDVTATFSNAGCMNHVIGPLVARSNITLSLSNVGLDCINQNILVLDSNFNPIYDVCAWKRAGVSVHRVWSIGGYVILQYINSLAQFLSAFIHYGSIDNSPATTAAPAPTTTAAPAPTTTAAPATTAVAQKCGVTYYAPITTGMKIVGGFKATPYSFPWQVLIYAYDRNGNGYMCGGSLISNQWIVTAAHCTKNIVRADVYLGIYYQDETNQATTTAISVSKIIPNPSYSSVTMKNDIALMKLSRPVTYSDKIQPICLPSSNLATAGRVPIVSGWGDTASNGNTSNPLLETTVPVQSLSYCDPTNQYNLDSTTQICAGDKTFNHVRDTCQGDSGGPLTLPNASGFYTLVGVTSFGGPCDGTGVYTNVNAYVGWINQVTSTQ